MKKPPNLDHEVRGEDMKSGEDRHGRICKVFLGIDKRYKESKGLHSVPGELEGTTFSEEKD